MTITMQKSETPQNQPAPGARRLRNDKHERFCLLIMAGDPHATAYEKVGYKPDGANAKRLLDRQEIQDRLAFLKAEVSKALVYDAAWVKDRLAKHAEALTEIVVTDDGSRKPGPMFNASAGARALELLGREHGLFKEKIELGGKVQHENRAVFERMTPAERATMRAMLQAAASRMPQPANENREPEPEQIEQQSGVVPNAG